ncbi:MAG: hypothetical protein ACP5K9_01255 [Candidatus Micrarchaeia archaeon]
MIKLQSESFAEKVIFRLIRKHIAGPTMNSAIKKAKAINAKGLPVSIAFLSDTPSARAKANYISNAYAQLIREMARQGIKSSVHLRMAQLGSGISKDIAKLNLLRLLEISRKYGILIWAEARTPTDVALLNEMSGNRGLGIFFSSIDDALSYVKKKVSAPMVKVLCKWDDGGKSKDYKKRLPRMLEELSSKINTLVLLSPDDEMLKYFSKSPNRHNVAFEFQLGYSEKKMGKITKNRKVSIYMPFGRDWAEYATDTVPEGYMRRLASSLLKEGVKKSSTSGDAIAKKR